MIQKIIQVGNSVGIIIPRSLESGFNPGDEVEVEKEGMDGVLVMTKKGSKTSRSTLTPRFFALVEKVNDRYASALKELADK